MFTSMTLLSHSSHFKFIIDYENIPVNTCQIFLGGGILLLPAAVLLPAPCCSCKAFPEDKEEKEGAGWVSGPLGPGRSSRGFPRSQFVFSKGFRSRLCSPAEPPPHSSLLPLSFWLNRKASCVPYGSC